MDIPNWALALVAAGALAVGYGPAISSRLARMWGRPAPQPRVVTDAERLDQIIELREWASGAGRPAVAQHLSLAIAELLELDVDRPVKGAKR